MHDDVGTVEVVDHHEGKEYSEEPTRNVISPFTCFITIHPQEREDKCKEELASIKICC